MSVVENQPTANRMAKKKRSTMYVTNDSESSSKRITGVHSKNSRQIDANGNRISLHSGSNARKSKNFGDGNKRRSLSKFQATMSVLDA